MMKLFSNLKEKKELPLQESNSPNLHKKLPKEHLLYTQKDR